MMGLISRFLPSLVRGLQALVNPVVLIALAAMAAGCFTAGGKVESWRWDTSLTALSEAHVKALEGFYKNQRVIVGDVARKLAAAEADRDTWADSFDEEMRHAPNAKLADCGCAPPSEPAAIACEPAGTAVRLPAETGSSAGTRHRRQIGSTGMRTRVNVPANGSSRESEVLNFSALLVLLGRRSRQSIYDLMRRDPTFPRPRRLGSEFSIGWLRAEVMQWLHSRPLVELNGLDAVERWRQRQKSGG